MPRPVNAPRVRCIVDGQELGDLVREILAAYLPGVDVALERPGHGGDAAVSSPADAESLVAAREALEETRRLVARGTHAARAQHAANNPLTALLAEAQLLELEPLPPEQRQAVHRMVELTRRVAAALRELDMPPSP